MKQKCIMDQQNKHPIINLAVPGSHNSFSYTITPDSEVSPDSPRIVQQLSHLFKIIVNPIIYKWSVTQNLDITSQLRTGVRYFDIRVVFHKGQLLVAHGLLGDPIFPLLRLVKSFLDENKKEIVILDFQHFYKFTSETHSILLESLKDIFSSKLSKCHGKICSVTLETMAERGEQVLVLYRSRVRTEFVWPSYVWPTPWPNKIRVEDLINCLDDGLKHRDLTTGLVTQCVLTVDPAYVLRHPFQNLKYIANEAKTKIFHWLQDVQQPSRINVVIADFVDIAFVKAVNGI